MRKEILLKNILLKIVLIFCLAVIIPPTNVVANIVLKFKFESDATMSINTSTSGWRGVYGINSSGAPIAEWNTTRLFTKQNINGVNWYSYTLMGNPVSVSGFYMQGQIWINGVFHSQSSTNMLSVATLDADGNYNLCYNVNAAKVWSITACPTVTLPNQPTVTLTIPTSIINGESISFSATSQNVTSPVYTYSVKVPGSTVFTKITTPSPYTPSSGLGNYVFKVEVAESSNVNTVLDSQEKTVIVSDKPAGSITVRWKKGDDLTWVQMGIYEWSTGGGQLCGAWPGKVITPDAEGWYSHTFIEKPENIIFNNAIATQPAGGKQLNGPIKPTSNICVELHPTFYTPIDCITGNPGTVEYIDIKWQNSLSWPDMAIYAWVGDAGITELSGPFPGEIITPIAGTYSKSFVKQSPINIIFSSPTSGLQSANITGVFENTCYQITDEKIVNELLQENYVVKAVNCGLMTDVIRVETSRISFYPNPATNSITLQTTENVSNVSIFSLIGERVVNVDGANNAIDISHLPTGSYLLKVLLSDSKTYTQKLMKN